MAIVGFPDICSDGTQVVGEYTTTPGPGTVWFDATARTSAERALYLRAVSLLGDQVAIYKGADSDTAYLINDAGVEVPLGATIGNQCVGIRIVSGQFEAVWIESQTVWKSQRYDAALVALSAVVTNAVPAAEVGHMGAGFLDLDASGVPIWTDTNRYVTVKGVPLVVAVRRGGYYMGQLGGGFVDQIVAVHGTTGARGTLYAGLGLEPHATLADGGSGAVYYAFRTLGSTGAQFGSFPPLPQFTGFLSQQAIGATAALAANTNPVPLKHPVADQATGLRMTEPWAAWAREANRLQRTPVNLMSGVTGILPPTNLGTGNASPNTVLRGDGTWGPLPTPETLPFTLDGYGAALTTGLKGFLYVPYNCVVTGVVLMADQAGSVVVDIWKDTVANFPPDNADSITGTAQPTLAAQQIAVLTALTGWSPTLATGEVLAFHIDSVSAIERVHGALIVARV